METDAFFDGLFPFRDTKGSLAQLARFLTGKQDGCKHFLLRIVQGFPSPVIVNACPGCHRPDVVKLPYHRAHASSAVSSEMLHAVPDSFRLQKLGSIQKRFKIARIQVGLCHVIHNFTVGCLIPLMHFHDSGEYIPILRQCKALHCFQAGEGLEAELGQITETVLPIVRKRLFTVPYIPVMGIPSVFVPGIVVISAGGRGGRPVKALRVFRFYHLRYDIFKNFNVVTFLFFGRLPAFIQRLSFHFVVAAPESNAGMVTQPAYILPYLFPDIFIKRLVQFIGSARKHEILPDKQSQFITDIVKIIVRIITAAPDSYGIVIGCLAIRKKLPCSFFVDSS